MSNTVAKLVFIPAPAVGHIISTVELAKVLVNRDQRLSISVLLINPPYSIPALNAYIKSLAINPIEHIRFIDLPQDQTPPKLDSKAPVTSFHNFINSHCKYVRNSVVDMINEPGSGRVVGFVVDIVCIGMIDVANEFDLPTYVFFTSTSAYLRFNLYIETLCVDVNQDAVVEMANSEGEIVLPGFVNRVPTKVVRAVCQLDEGLDFLVHSFKNLRKAKGIMVNTFLELETHAIESFRGTNFPPVYPVGPVLNLDEVAGKADDMDVIRWLDGQPPSSVVLLCFGSMGSFNEAQVKEIARGLEQSGHRFVWALRRPRSLDQSSGGSSDNYDGVLPDGFLERTSKIGRVIEWAPQVSLLAHEAVGGFVSHCGWNSILESLWFGVPIATWPMYAEQQMNAFEIVVELGFLIYQKPRYNRYDYRQAGRRATSCAATPFWIANPTLPNTKFCPLIDAVLLLITR